MLWCACLLDCGGGGIYVKFFVLRVLYCCVVSSSCLFILMVFVWVCALCCCVIYRVYRLDCGGYCVKLWFCDFVDLSFPSSSLF